MSGSYWYAVEFGDTQLRVLADDADGKLDPARLAQQAEMLAAGWNARYDARHCDGHEWGERWPLEEAVWGPGLSDRTCVKCLVAESVWEAQKDEEALL